MKKIIINADDFGLNQSCTKAICKAFESNLITDTTMVANGEAFNEAVSCVEKYRLNDRIGIHFNLTDGEPLTKPITECGMFVSNGKFHGHVNRLKPLCKLEKQAVYAEFTAQIGRLEDAGISVTHADSHHHIHTGIFISPIFVRVCKEHGIQKVRLHRNIGTISWYKKLVKYFYNCWLRYNGFLTTQRFGSMEDVRNVGILDELEIMVHPEFDASGRLVDKVAEENRYPVGAQLTLPKGNYTLRGYKDL